MAVPLRAIWCASLPYELPHSHTLRSANTLTCCLFLVFALHLPPVVLVLQPPQCGTHSNLAFVTLPLPIHSVDFLKLTASSRPSPPPSGSPKCLRFGHWLILLQERVWDDVAVATSFRQVDRSWARRFAVVSPRFIGRRSASMVLSQDCLGRPILRLQLSGGSAMQAWRARWLILSTLNIDLLTYLL